MLPARDSPLRLPPISQRIARPISRLPTSVRPLPQNRIVHPWRSRTTRRRRRQTIVRRQIVPSRTVQLRHRRRTTVRPQRNRRLAARFNQTSRLSRLILRRIVQPSHLRRLTVRRRPSRIVLNPLGRKPANLSRNPPRSRKRLHRPSVQRSARLRLLRSRRQHLRILKRNPHPLLRIRK